MKRILAVLIGLMLLATAVISVSACTTGEQKASAAELINASNAKIVDAKSYHTDFDVHISMQGDQQDTEKLNPLGGSLPQDMTVSMKMDLDTRNPGDMHFRMYELNFKGLDDALNSSGTSTGENGAQSQAGSEMFNSMLSGMEMSFVDNTFYMKMGGQWYELSLKDMPTSNGADFQCLMNESMSQNAAGSLVPTSGLKDIQELSEESIDGVSMRHFKASVDADKVIEQMNNSTSAYEKCGFSTSSGGTGTGTTDTGSSASSAINTDALKSMFQNATLDFWIDADGNLRQVKTVMDMNMSDLAGLSGGMSGGLSGLSGAVPMPGDLTQTSLTMKMEMTAKLSNFGENVDVTKPADAKPFMDLFGLSSLGSSALGGLSLGGSSLDGSSVMSGMGSTAL